MGGRRAAALPNETPVDHPGLEPIWRAAEDHDFAIVHHSFTWSAPYFPGYTEMWDNVYLARLCSHPWGAMRFMAGFLAGGILDRYPGLRLCVLECGFGWLPFWVRRMDEQVSYVGRTAKLKLLPSEQFAAGRVFANIEVHEHEPMFEMVTQALGDFLPDVRLRLPAFRIVVPQLDRQDLGVEQRHRRSGPRSCCGKTPTAASSGREEGAMKRVDIAAYGVAEEVASCVEVPDVGAPGPGEVVFDVPAFPINPADLSMIRGNYRLHPALPATPGAECVGRVTAAAPA